MPKFLTNVRSLINSPAQRVPAEWRRKGVNYPLPADHEVEVIDPESDYAVTFQFINDAESGRPVCTGVSIGRRADVERERDAKLPGAPKHTGSFEAASMRGIARLPLSTYQAAAEAALAGIFQKTASFVVRPDVVTASHWKKRAEVFRKAQERGEDAVAALLKAEGLTIDDKTRNRAHQWVHQMRRRRLL